MRAGREADDQDLCRGVAEAGDRASPVFLVEVCSALGAGDVFTVFD
jgi:hypothetical protein